MSGLDWPGLMRVGLHGLGLAPDHFWALTPGELQVMLGRGGAWAPMSGDGLAALMAAYPDVRKGQDDG